MKRANGSGNGHGNLQNRGNDGNVHSHEEDYQLGKQQLYRQREGLHDESAVNHLLPLGVQVRIPRLLFQRLHLLLQQRRRMRFGHPEDEGEEKRGEYDGNPDRPPPATVLCDVATDDGACGL